MEINAESGWEVDTLKGCSKTFTGYRREAKDFTTEYAFLKENVTQVALSGGALLLHQFEPKVIEEKIDPWGNKGFRYDTPRAEMWYLPVCSFQESLELLDSIDFPKLQPQEDGLLVRAWCKRLLLELTATRILAMLNLTRTTVFVENVQGNALSAKEIAKVLDFNQQHFGTNYGRAEYKDLASLYKRKSFFVLGRM